MKIVVAGLGYVGLANAALFAGRHDVTGVDISEKKVRLINQRKSPIADVGLDRFLAREALSLKSTTDGKAAYKNADYIIIATPTDYDAEKNCFDTSSVEAVLQQAMEVNREAVFVIRSTVPIGYTESLKKEYGYGRVVFAPEFLREGSALHDSLNPSRIIVGCDINDSRLRGRALEFIDMMKTCTLKDNIPSLLMKTAEAEAVKLFSNTYLALRVAFFNELDSFAETYGFNAREIIDGVCLDTRIGNYYNNPSFGYGGYCLPKDTRQLLANYRDIPNRIIEAVVESNQMRKAFIAERILKNGAERIGIYRLVMKLGADNCRNSSMLDIINLLQEKGAELLVYEPCLTDLGIYGAHVIKNLEEFKASCDLIVANRYDSVLDDVAHKVYTRDLFAKD